MLVLEVGSGHRPDPRADVLCDKHIYSDEQRGGHLKPGNRPFIAADLCVLPFKANSFDFVICKHVIEHLDNPSMGLQELQRIAKAGYIEAPHDFWEYIEPHRAYHKYYVRLHDNVLLFKKKQLFCSPYQNAFKNMGGTNFAFKLFTASNQHICVTKYYWKDQIKYRILNESEELPLIEESTDLSQTPFIFLKDILKRVGEKTRDAVRVLAREAKRDELSLHDLVSLLECPDCRNSIKYAEESYFCAGCGRSFDFKDEVLFMLPQSLVGLDP